MVPTDLVAMTVETYTARRAYQIAAHYRRAGVPVVMGGYHPTLLPDEALAARRRGRGRRRRGRLGAGARRRAPPAALQRLYRAKPGDGGAAGLDRSIFARQALRAGLAGPVRPRLPLQLRLLLDPRLLRDDRAQRDPADVVAEMRTLPRRRLVFFVDDNLFGGATRSRSCCARSSRSKMRWSCQITIDVARDDALLELMAQSRLRAGAGRLRVARRARACARWQEVEPAPAATTTSSARFHARGIMIYGTFVFGYDADTPASFDRAAEFARDHSLCLANFNPLTPMPGTALYDRLRARGPPAARRLVARPGLPLRRRDLRAARHDAPTSCTAGRCARARALLQLALHRRRALRGAPIWRSPYRLGTCCSPTSSRAARSSASRAGRWRRAAGDLVGGMP